jgi:hypothetical protein
MKFKEFEYNVNMLKSFFPIHCNDQHKKQIKNNYIMEYKFEGIEFEVALCKDCHDLLKYSIKRLQECPYEVKPKCRKCLKPCYNTYEWKSLAKIMRHSGTKLGYINIKNRFKKLIY